MIWNIPLTKITPDDLKSLVKTTENQRMDFKVDYSDIFVDVAAMANANGGDIVIGIQVGTGDSEGVAIAVPGIPSGKVDGTMDQIRNKVDDKIEPKLMIEMKEVRMGGNKSCIVIRIIRSFERPHAVRVQKDQYSFPVRAFPIRNNNGNSYMDMRQLRNVFSSVGEIPQQIRRWQRKRIKTIVKLPSKGTSYNDLNDRLVVHLIPISAFEGGKDIKVIRPDYESPITDQLKHWAAIYRYNLDGVLGEKDEQGDGWSYVQIYRDGKIEAVHAGVTREVSDQMLNKYDTTRGNKLSDHVLHQLSFEDVLIRRLESVVKAAQLLSVETPAYLFLTLIGFKGWSLSDIGAVSNQSSYPFDTDILILPEIVITAEDNMGEMYLKNILDSVFQTCGYEGSPSYDSGGRWVQFGDKWKLPEARVQQR